MAIVREGTSDKDVFEADQAAETFDGREEFDTVRYDRADAGVTLDLSDPANNTGYAAGDTFAGIERYYLTDFDDRFVGSEERDYAYGGAGDDILIGAGGDDVLVGHGGANQYFGGLATTASSEVVMARRCGAAMARTSSTPVLATTSSMAMPVTTYLSTSLARAMIVSTVDWARTSSSSNCCPLI